MIKRGQFADAGQVDTCIGLYAVYDDEALESALVFAGNDIESAIDDGGCGARGSCGGKVLDFNGHQDNSESKNRGGAPVRHPTNDPTLYQDWSLASLSAEGLFKCEKPGL